MPISIDNFIKKLSKLAASHISMLKTTAVTDKKDENLNQDNKQTKWKIEIEKNWHKKVIKVNKWQNQNSRSVPKKQMSSKQKISELTILVFY